ncbi:hypothetical protein SAMN05216199_1556 [Pedococcus cremeus]|uniref:Uncharacterized protein n=1 Tax=Pedococcus cremeus TaxID=587636 RepID=A0A1H9TDR8_9MICO|nr:hypothetical protein SAMN05216199_1556 [Pedococcus cremeus]
MSGPRTSSDPRTALYDLPESGVLNLFQASF